ncbi:DUF6318 family protein [Promicromonospora sp. MS192]|uniref:DUF6318 family protein n=1 Tax=Promicromonospora sp. MS192 TaxID=3412684 RepID=UPI003C30B932
MAAGLVLCGCTGVAEEPAPPASASPSPSASPSASVPTPVKPERPAAMERDDAEGAAAAAEYFIELYPYVMATGDVEEFEALSHRACSYCRGTLENSAWLRDTGSTFQGGLTDAKLEKVYQKDQLTGVIPLDFRTSQSEIWIHDKRGREVDHVDETDFDARVEIGRRGGAWVVVEIAPDPEDER